VAARWWEMQLKSNDKSKFEHNLPENSPITILNYLMQDLCSQHQLDSFFVHLKIAIQKELEKWSSLKLYSNYYPCVILEEAGLDSGILGISFPLFVDMQITTTTVKVRFLDQPDYTILCDYSDGKSYLNSELGFNVETYFFGND
jgi:hypothetical protein